MRWRLRPRDFLWGIASPLYILLGTIRHEGSHALIGLAVGEKIDKFVFWPTRFGWGYVQFTRNPPSAATAVTAAPYVVDAIVFVAAAWLCMRVPERLHWLWVNLAIVGVASPAVDSLYNYVKAFHGGGDVAHLVMTLGAAVVHTWFIAWAVVFVFYSVKVLRQSPVPR